MPLKIGYALCGSFCTFADSMAELRKLAKKYEIFPIMSANAFSINTRFGKAQDFIYEIEHLTNKNIIHTIEDAEPIGPQKLLDALIISPCTGNTLGKLHHGITDTSVTMAAKASLRNEKPLILAIATNDALSASYANIGGLASKKNVFFVPYTQDNAQKKPTSMIADFTLVEDTLLQALEGRQLQPLILPPK